MDPRQANVTADSVEKCCAACGERPECDAFSFDTKAGRCFLIAHAIDRKPADGFVSGFCQKMRAPSSAYGWTVVKGTFEVAVGASSTDLRLDTRIEVAEDC